MTSHPISVRLDDEARRALSVIEATGLSRSGAIRDALVARAEKIRRRESLRAEAEALAADPEDAAEMRAVAAEMDQFRAAR